MENELLIKALRWCQKRGCSKCVALLDNGSCKYGGAIKIFDAAAALEAQMPKEGEWQWDEAKCMYRCSVCKSPKAREDMDRKIVKEQPFCYNCGARCK